MSSDITAHSRVFVQDTKYDTGDLGDNALLQAEGTVNTVTHFLIQHIPPK